MVYANERSDMKRRQQGILTGMPFMANLASRTLLRDIPERRAARKWIAELI